MNKSNLIVVVCFFCSFCIENHQIYREKTEKNEGSKGDSAKGEEELKGCIIYCIPCKM